MLAKKKTNIKQLASILLINFMENLDLTEILNREKECLQMRRYVETFYKVRTATSTSPKNHTKRGLYLFGKSGIGKTSFVKRNLIEWNYDVIIYDAGESRNKSIIETISNSNLSSVNILSSMRKKQKRIVLVMDEIDGMNNGDRGGITSLIKLIRTKKTKKQSTEPSINIPVICIGDCHSDKKINELKKVCEIIELLAPTKSQMEKLLHILIPHADTIFKDFVGCDLRKLELLYKIDVNERKLPPQMTTSFLRNDFSFQSHWQPDAFTSTDVKQTASTILSTRTSFLDHDNVINDNDRTIVGLLYHENVVDLVEKLKPHISFQQLLIKYTEVLSNLCFSDYIDRIIFQKQIWHLNEMSSLTKTSYNSFIIQQCFKKKIPCLQTIRFTKILTKYSSEYNNASFIIDMSQSLMLDKSDLFSFFLYIKEKLENDQTKILQLLSSFDVSNLDTLRMFRYIEKYIEHSDEIDEEDDAKEQEMIEEEE
jgi:hypothetical protein